MRKKRVRRIGRLIVSCRTVREVISVEGSIERERNDSFKKVRSECDCDNLGDAGVEIFEGPAMSEATQCE
jgi:hypothetical protein